MHAINFMLTCKIIMLKFNKTAVSHNIKILSVNIFMLGCRHNQKACWYTNNQCHHTQFCIWAQYTTADEDNQQICCNIFEDNVQIDLIKHVKMIL